MEPKDRIIFPLDVYSFDEAALLVGRLKRRVGMLKVGYALLLREGRSVLNRLHELSGLPLFVDLKFHDIPRSVQQAATVVTSACEQVRFLTVHLNDGEAIACAAVNAVRPGVGVLGVTVLTSLSAAPDAAHGASEQVTALARVGRQAGCEGVVCSGHEVQAVKQALGREFLVIVPGIRPGWAEITNDDQRRAMTPGEAISRGADYLVVGRPIAASPDP
ncbi:MAG: orotidine-5'-phosphate decarboxylase, partial [Nitrospirota bacterium]